MTTSDEHQPETGTHEHGGGVGGDRGGGGEHGGGVGRVAALRGAPVQVNPRIAGRAAVVGVALALAVLVAVLTAAAIHRNSQLDELAHDGVRVTATVTDCHGLLGGSGSNAAGDSCVGHYTVDGQRYVQNLPGMAAHRIGSSVVEVTTHHDPTLLATPVQVATEHASWTAFILPGALFVLLLALLAVAAVTSLRRTRRTAAQSEDVGGV